jgi:hypothetical protein
MTAQPLDVPLPVDTAGDGSTGGNGRLSSFGGRPISDESVARSSSSRRLAAE